MQNLNKLPYKSLFQHTLSFDSQTIQLFEKYFGPNYISKLTKKILFPPKFVTVRMNTLWNENESNAKEKLKKLNWPFKYDSRIKSFHFPIEGPFETTFYEDSFLLVDTNCATSILRGAHVFAPGVYATSPSIKENVSVLCLLDTFGISKSSKVTLNEIKNCIYLGNGKLKMERQDIFHGTKKGIAAEMNESIFRGPSLNSINGKDFLTQSFPSIVTSLVLDPLPNDMILDMCASPGGKTTHIANLMKNKGHIIAWDRSHNKVSEIKNLCEIQGITIVEAMKMNALYAKSKGFDVKFDKILLDAPCSCMGQIPYIRNPKSFKDLQNNANYQKALLKESLNFLKDDGILVYSTCTISPLENEFNVKFAMEELGLQLIEPPIGFNDLKDFAMGGLKSILNEKNGEKVLRFDPIFNENMCIGFFIAKFQKVKKFYSIL